MTGIPDDSIPRNASIGFRVTEVVTKCSIGRIAGE